MFRPLPPWPLLYLYVGLTAFVLAAFLTPLCVWILRRFDVLDPVADNKIHDRPIPRGGGIAIFLAFAIAVVLPNYRDNPMKGVLVGSFICLLVGAIDDLRGGVPAVVKFVALVVSTVVMSYFGVQLHLFGYYPLDLLVTVIWIVGVTSAFNGIDNMDGLAAGVAVVVSAMYLTIAYESFVAAGTETSLSWFGLLAAGLIGANLGFLIFNFRPAKVFMGDSGSFFLGFTLSALGVMGEWSEHRIISCTIPVLILGVPIFDFGYILIMRIVQGKTRTLRSVIEHCATDHLSHRLTWIGFSQTKAVLFIYLIAFALGISGILLHFSENAFNSALGLLQGLAVVSIVIILMAAAERRHAKAMQLEAVAFPGPPDPSQDEEEHETKPSVAASR